MKRTREEASCEGITRERGKARLEDAEVGAGGFDDVDDITELVDEEEDEGVRVSRKPPPLITFTSARQFLVKPQAAAAPPVPALRPTSTSTSSTTTTSAKKKKPVLDYTYTRLSDIHVDENVNVYAVVCEFKEPRPSRGTDWVVSVTLVDVSAPSREEGLKVNMFAGAQNKLPAPRRGDIMRLHRLFIQRYGSSLQGVGNVRKGCSWIVVDGSSDAPIAPRSSSSENPTFTDRDEEKVKSLRIWASSVNIVTPTSESTITILESPLSDGPQYLRSICEIEDNAYFDLICKIIDVRHESAVPSLIVWDGTKAPLDTDGLNADGQPVDKHGLSSRLRVILDMNPMVQGQLLSLPLNTWVHLRNIRGHTHTNGYMYCAARLQSKFQVVHFTDPRVESRTKAYEEKERMLLSEKKETKVSHALLRAPALKSDGMSTGPATSVVRCTDLPLSTIRDILNHPEVNPERVEEITRASAVKPDAPFVYLFQFLLADQTGELTVYVYDQEAALLFGLEAVNLEENRCTRDFIQHKLEALLAQSEPSEFLIKSYHLDRNRPLTTRRYQLTSTVLIASS